MCVASFLPSISEKNPPPRVQKINLKACRCGLTGMCLCSWTVDLGREELTLARRARYSLASQVSEQPVGIGLSYIGVQPTTRLDRINVGTSN
jgi:hypothetical protein